MIRYFLLEIFGLKVFMLLNLFVNFFLYYMNFIKNQWVEVSDFLSALAQFLFVWKGKLSELYFISNICKFAKVSFVTKYQLNDRVVIGSRDGDKVNILHFDKLECEGNSSIKAKRTIKTKLRLIKNGLTIMIGQLVLVLLTIRNKGRKHVNTFISRRI